MNPGAAITDLSIWKHADSFSMATAGSIDKPATTGAAPATAAVTSAQAETAPGQAKAAASGQDHVTILTGEGRATKLVTLAGFRDYDAGKWFRVTSVRVRGIVGLARVLARVEAARRSFVIRAELIEGCDPLHVRRLLSQDRLTGEGPFFAPCPRYWLGLDIDSIDLPVGISAVDLEAVARLALSSLPEVFRQATTWAQLTSGAGIKPGGRVRLFFWLERALGGPELKRWLADAPGLDHATLNDVTPHYVARPVFRRMADPVHVRSKLIQGELDTVSVPELPPAPNKPLPDADASPYVAPDRGLGAGSTRAEKYMLACLQALTGAPEGQGRDQCLRVAARLYGLAKAGLLDAADATARIKGAMRGRGWCDDDPHGCTPAELDRILSWALAHAEPKGLPQ